MYENFLISYTSAGQVFGTNNKRHKNHTPRGPDSSSSPQFECTTLHTPDVLKFRYEAPNI